MGVPALSDHDLFGSVVTILPKMVPLVRAVTVPFAATRQEREARGDPRPSIEERYPSRNAYLEQVRQAAQRLVEDGYLLAEDLELVVDQAAERFDNFARPSGGTTR